MTVEVFSLPGVTKVHQHAWNHDSSFLAVSLNSSEVWIFKCSKTGKEEIAFTLLNKFLKYTHRVTALDWSSSSNQLVSCSQDRTSFVHSLDPSGVVTSRRIDLNLDLGATSAKWSPCGDKIAIGSSSAVIAIAFEDPESKTWTSKNIKKFLSKTILSISWHPNNFLFAASSADGTVRVLSAFLKEMDVKPTQKYGWGDKFPFNTLCAEYSSKANCGWATSVTFSSDGDSLAWSDFSGNIYIGRSLSDSVQILSLSSSLPYLQLSFLNNNTILAAGHDKVVHVFQLSEEHEWIFLGSLQGTPQSKQVQNKSSFSALNIFDKFKHLELGSRALQANNNSHESKDSSAAASLNTVHKFPISCMQLVDDDSSLSTSSIEGLIARWNLKSYLADKKLESAASCPSLITSVDTLRKRLEVSED